MNLPQEREEDDMCGAERREWPRFARNVVLLRMIGGIGGRARHAY